MLACGAGYRRSIQTHFNDDGDDNTERPTSDSDYSSMDRRRHEVNPEHQSPNDPAKLNMAR